MTNFEIYQQKSIKLGVPGIENNQIVEISQKAVQAGLLNNFPGKTLSIFLYLITNIDNNNSAFINPSNITEYLPYKLKDIIESLNKLEKKGFIDIIQNNNDSKSRDGFNLKINLEKINSVLAKNQNSKNNATENDNQINNPKNSETRQTKSKIDKQNSETKNQLNNINKTQLENILKSYIPSEKEEEKIIKNINQWLEDFSIPVLKELIRRVEKWQNNTDTPDDKAFFYLRAIIEDWYDKEIYDYQQLQNFDQLYRETKQLAQTYGINKWKNVETVQMQTFKNWLTEDFALSVSVAKYAIKQAIKRKKDGQPSLKYIEDNFINPFKQAKVKNVDEAKQYLKSGSSKHKNSKQNKNKTNYNTDNMDNWNKFEWDLDKIN